MRDEKGRFIKGGHYNPKRDNWIMIKCPCGKEIKRRFSCIERGREKYCSKSCGYKYKKFIPWNKGLKGLQIAWNKGKKFPEFSGEKSSNWKGDTVKYNGLHAWIKKRKIKSEKCEFCDSSDYVQLANRSYLYLRDIADWIWLCAKCHRKYDLENGWGIASLKYPEIRGRNLCV